MGSVYRPVGCVDGRKVRRKFYMGKHRFSGDARPTSLSLETSDKRVAEKRLAEFIQQTERERAGVAVPKMMAETAARPLVDLVKAYVDELRAGRRLDAKYCDNAEKQLLRVVRDVGWRLIRDITEESFKAWRSSAKHQQTGERLSVKTVNDYLAHLHGLFKWLGKRVMHDPLADVRPVSRKHQDKVRRAFCDEDLVKVLGAAGRFRLGMLFMATTGVRVKETRKLVWGGLYLDGDSPVFDLRASSTKNGNKSRCPLFGGLAAELLGHRPADASAGDFVFGRRGVPTNEQLRRVLRRAGVAEKDAVGRKLCVHSLRHTFNTLLHRWGLVDGEIMRRMRVSDRKLIDRTYLDASLLDKRLAEDVVPWLPVRSPERSPGRSLGLDTTGRGVAGGGTGTTTLDFVKRLENKHGFVGFLGHSDLALVGCKNGEGRNRTYLAPLARWRRRF